MSNVAESIRKKVRRLIIRLGSSGNLYVFSSATVVKNDYGDDTSIIWGSPVSIKFISSNHILFKKLLGLQGVENDKGERSIILADNVTIIPSMKDKFVIDTTNYEVISMRVIDPIQDTIIAYRVGLKINEAYK